MVLDIVSYFPYAKKKLNGVDEEDERRMTRTEEKKMSVRKNEENNQ